MYSLRKNEFELNSNYNPLNDSMMSDDSSSSHEPTYYNKQPFKTSYSMINPLKRINFPNFKKKLLLIFVFISSVILIFMLFKFVISFKDSNGSLNEKITLLTNQLSALQQQNQKLQTENNELSSTYEDLQKKISSFKNEKDTILKQTQEKENSFGLMKMKVSTLEEKLNEKEKQLRENQNQLSSLNSQISLLSSRAIQYEKTIDELNKAVTSLKNQIDSLKLENNALEQKNRKTFNDLLHSSIFRDKEEVDTIAKYIDPNHDISFSLIYSSQYYSDSRSTFHEKVDKHDSTLVLIETDKGKRFGGYTKIDWEPLSAILSIFGIDYFKDDKNSFLFSLDMNKKYPITETKKAIYSDKKHLLAFGNGDIVIKDNFLSKSSESFFPKSYGSARRDSKMELTGGSKDFRIKTLEIFSVIILN